MSLRDFRAFYLGVPIHPQHYGDTTYYCPCYRRWKILRGMPFGKKLAPFYCSAVSIEVVMGLRGEIAKIRRETVALQMKHRARVRRGRASGRRCRVKKMPLRGLRRWAEEVELTVYVDDTFNKAESDKALRAGDIFVTDIVRTKYGLPFAEGEKAVDAIPTQRKTFLGVRIITTGRLVQLGITAPRCLYLVHSLSEVIEKAAAERPGVLLQNAITTDRLESLLGSLCFALAFVRGMLNFLSTAWELRRLRKKSSQSHWRKGKGAVMEALVKETLKDFTTLRNFLAKNADGMSVVIDTAKQVTYIRIKSDAAGSAVRGWGYATTDDEGVHHAHDQGVWVGEQRGWDILTKELFPVVEALEAHGEEWRGRVVMSGVDNAGLAACINAQRARDVNTREQMRRLAMILHKYDITLLGFWTPRIWNLLTDLMSKGMVFDDAVVCARRMYAAQMLKSTRTASSAE